MLVPKNQWVSVVVPTYNRAHCLRATLESALSQETGDYGLEVLVIDDGSTDGTETMLRKAFPNEPRIRYFKQANAGVSAARNRGIREVQGDLIAFLDSDDLWLPGKLAKQLRCLEEVPEAGMVWTDMDAIDPNGNIVARNYLRKMYRAYRWFPKLGDLFSNSGGIDSAKGYWGDIFSPMVLGNLVHTSTVLMRRSRLEKVGFFREDFRRGGEDYEFHLRTCREGPVAYLDVSTLHYRIGFQDALTKPENNVAMALAYLETLAGILRTDLERIQLPPGRIESALADAHSWAARELLVQGNINQARTHFRASLSQRLWQPSQYKFMLASLLPQALLQTLLRLRRSSE